MLNHQLKTVGNRGVSENSLFFAKNTSIRYICFNVKIRFNNLISEQNPNKFSKKQHSRYRLIKTFHENGLGYRRILAYLNEKGFTTENGHIWKPNYVYSVLKRFKERQGCSFFKDHFDTVNSEGTVFGSVNGTDLRGIKTPVANSEILNSFEKIVSPTDESIRVRSEEIKVLSELRDTLLPKLISGELRFPDAEKFLEEAGI